MSNSTSSHGHNHNHSHGDEQLAPEGGREPPLSGPAQMQTRQLEYARAIRAPMVAIRAELRRGIVERGIFDPLLSSGDGEGPAGLNLEQLGPAFDPADLTPSGFRFDDEDQAHERFMDWLRREQAAGVLSVVSRDNNIYVRRALTDGDRWAIARLREAGYEVGVGAAPVEAYAPRALDASRPSRALSVGGTFDRPMPASTVRLLFERNYSLLEGITTDVSQDIGEVLSSGLARGLNPNEIAREMTDRVDSVGLNRATLMARHETMYAFNENAKHRFRQQGVERVRILGTTPCEELCAPYVGNTYPLENIPHGGPPYHPNCVCCTAPAPA